MHDSLCERSWFSGSARAAARRQLARRRDEPGARLHHSPEGPTGARANASSVPAGPWARARSRRRNLGRGNVPASPAQAVARRTLCRACGPCRGERFLFLNDLAFAPNGYLYLTDSGILLDELAPGGELNPDYRSLRYDGRVYRVDVRTAAVELLDRGLQFANGIAFGPDGGLYVTETLTGNIYRYACRWCRRGTSRDVRQRDRTFRCRRAQRARRHEVRSRWASVRRRVRPGRHHGARSARRGRAAHQDRGDAPVEPALSPRSTSRSTSPRSRRARCRSSMSRPAACRSISSNQLETPAPQQGGAVRPRQIGNSAPFAE